jgi:hypothetical protein
MTLAELSKNNLYISDLACPLLVLASLDGYKCLRSVAINFSFY